MIKSSAQHNFGRFLSLSYFLPLRFRMPMFFLLMVIGANLNVSAASFGEALYLSLQPVSPLPAVPSSLLIGSAAYINVPAGAKLSVYLMRGDSLVATSTLNFQNAYSNERLIPSRPIALFVPPGTSGASSGEPIPGAMLTAGETDLNKVALEPTLYRLLWILSAGMMDSPRQMIVTGGSTGFALVDIKLSAVSAAVGIGDQKPGSVLFFNRYTSSASNSLREDSTLNLTNTNPAAPAYVRLFLVTSATCQTTEIQLCLAAQQTVSLLMSDLDPGVRGYAIAIASNLQGEPTQFNWLTGNVVLRQPAANIAGSYNTVLGAVAIAKRKEGNAANVNGLAELVFDDVTYDRLPGQIAFDSVPSQVSATNATLFSIYRPLADLSGAVSSTSVQITGFGQNSQGQVISATGNLSSACYSDVAMGTFRLQPTPINQLLPSGATAWFTASSNDLLPLLGAQFNTGEFNAGGNARPLSFSAEFKIRVPVSPVTCPQS